MGVEVPAKKGHGVRNFLLVIFGLYLIGRVCDGGSGTTSQFNTPPPSSRVQVSLQIQGGGDLTYNNEDGNTEQRSGQSAAGEWAVVDSFSVERGEFLYISIQNAYETGGVAFRILVDGVVTESADSSGAYVIATCSGSA